MLRLLRSLSLDESTQPHYIRFELEADEQPRYTQGDEAFCSPPTTHLVAMVEDLTDLLDYASEDFNGMDLEAEADTY